MVRRALIVLSLLLFFIALPLRVQAAAESLSGPTDAGSGGAVNPVMYASEKALIQSAVDDRINLNAFVGGCGDTVTRDGQKVGTVPNGVSCETLVLFNRLILGSQQDGSPGKLGNNTGYRLYAAGAIPTTVGMIATIYKNPVASSTEYIADLWQNLQRPFGAQPAYAQGLGFSSLSPILRLWKVFRNLAYFFFVIIFAVVGFLIMIRAKIGSQAAVTVQQMLPKLVVALILVTFSYALAGLLIDVMYLIIFLIIGIFTQVLGASITIKGGFVGNNTSLVDIAFKYNIVQNTLSFITNGVVGNIAGTVGVITATSLGLKTSDIREGGIQGIANILVTLILAVSILANLFRVFFALISAYFNIFMLTVTAPIQFLFSVFSGKNALTTWATSMLENLIVFPVLIFLIFVAYYFSTGSALTTSHAGFSAPQLSSNQGEGTSVYQALFALGSLLAMPEVIKIAKGLMKGQLGVGLEDLKKNFDAGRKGAKRLALSPVDAAIGGAVGAYAGHKLGGGWRSYVGAGLGAIGGAATGIPTKAAPKLISEGAELFTKFGTVQVAGLIKRRSQQAETARKLAKDTARAKQYSKARQQPVKADTTLGEK